MGELTPAILIRSTTLLSRTSRRKRLIDATVTLALKVLFRSFSLFDLLVPKDRRLVVFAQTQDRFSDNNRALFTYMSRERSALEAIWIATTPAQQSIVEGRLPEANVRSIFTFGGFWTALRAKTVVVSHGLTDFHPLRVTSGRKTVLMLWHATSYKKTSVVNAGWSKQQVDRHLAHVARHISLMIASSGLDRLAKAASHGIDARRVLVTGLPRNDQLFSPEGPASLPGLDRALAGRVVLYAPTWRESGAATRFFPFPDFEVEQLNRFLADQDCCLLIRPHQNDRVSLATVQDWSARGADRVIGASPLDIPDVADILPHVDVIVTDYSSIYLDLLLRDVPSIFVPYDREHFDEARGLLYDYEAITPGPKVRTQVQFIDALRDALQGGESHRHQRDLLRRLFHDHRDANACRRVVEALVAHLGVDQRVGEISRLQSGRLA